MTSIAPTQAFWADEEATGADVYAGVVPTPQNVGCEFNRPFGGSTSLRWLEISWAEPETSSRTLEVEDYRFDFSARQGSPAPITASRGSIPGFSYTDFRSHLVDARREGLGRPVFEYEIRLVSEGPGGWESNPVVIEIRVQADRLLFPGSGAATCRVLGASGEQRGSFDSQDAPSEDGLDEPPLEEGGVLEEEIESDDSTSVPSPTPTEESASPEEDPEVDGPASTTSPAPGDEPGSPGEGDPPEPEESPTEESPTEEEPSESGGEQDTEGPGDDEESPESDGASEPSSATAPEDPQG